MSSHHRKASLQTIGIDGPVWRFLALAVVCALVFLPVAPVFAAEEAAEEVVSDNSETAILNEEPTDLEVADVVEEAPPEEPVPDEEVPEDSVDGETPITEDVGDVQASTTDEVAAEPEVSEEPSSDEVGTTTPEQVPDTTATTTEEIAAATTTDETATSSTDTPDVPAPGGNDESEDSSPNDTSATSTPNDTTTTELDEEVVEEDPVVVEENVATTTEEDVAGTTTPETVPEPQVVGATIVFNDQNKYQFSKEECVVVGDGTYYCTKDQDSTQALDRDGVFARIDSDGDREIYVTVDDTMTKITDNQYDDDAPYYDEKSETIVWHRLLDGRYQVFEYDLGKGEERQLTHERYNNMQPSRDGEVIVWQGWVGNDWEIMLEDAGEFTMVTDNTVHDISPRISGNHIIWQSFENEAWRVKVYDLASGNIETISDAEGGSVENPRFVLVYDTKFDNGDVETRGYDLESGQVVPLSSEPGPLPSDIPNPDPVDEERALVQTVTQTKPKPEGDTDLDIEDNPDTSDAIVADDTMATSSEDIIIPPFEDGATTTEDIPPNIEDLVITTPTEEVITDTGATSTTEIADVVVEPFIPEEDPQDTVATST